MAEMRAFFLVAGFTRGQDAMSWDAGVHEDIHIVASIDLRKMGWDGTGRWPGHAYMYMSRASCGQELRCRPTDGPTDHNPASIRTTRAIASLPFDLAACFQSQHQETSHQQPPNEHSSPSSDNPRNPPTKQLFTMMRKFRESLAKTARKDPPSSAAAHSSAVCHACGQQAPPSSSHTPFGARSAGIHDDDPARRHHRSSWNSTSTADSGYESLATAAAAGSSECGDTELARPITSCELDGDIYTMPYDPLHFHVLRSRSVHRGPSTPASSIYSDDMDPLQVEAEASIRVQIEEAKQTPDSAPPPQQDPGLPTRARSTTLPHTKSGFDTDSDSDDSRHLAVWPRIGLAPSGAPSADPVPATPPRSRYARLNELPAASPRASIFSPDVLESMEDEAAGKTAAAAAVAQRGLEPRDSGPRRWHKRATLSVGILPSQLRRLSLGRPARE
ncbi:hypothetical protein BD289DRAFT_43635 [Coniella lustricola]|uniref:Uncharacterized protein n=1 Tax=Coniella lustricola TaxID=2025994 RepID=A0A2T3A1S7_9PEZI|nr:hypothetical protein BD289DRAFT_43635 [Coniella lustricola]